MPCHATKRRPPLVLRDRGVPDDIAADERQIEPLLANQLVELASIQHSAVTKNVAVPPTALYKKNHPFSGSNSCQCYCGKFLKVLMAPLNMKKIRTALPLSIRINNNIARVGEYRYRLRVSYTYYVGKYRAGYNFDDRQYHYCEEDLFHLHSPY